MFKRLDKALGPDLGQCCGGRVPLTHRAVCRGGSPGAGARGGRTRRPVDDDRGRRRRWTPGARIAAADVGEVRPAAYERAVRRPRASSASATSRRRSICSAQAMSGARSRVALAPLPFAVTWIDPRPGRFRRIPVRTSRCISARRSGASDCGAPDGAFIADHDAQPRARSRSSPRGAARRGAFPMSA